MLLSSCGTGTVPYPGSAIQDPEKKYSDPGYGSRGQNRKTVQDPGSATEHFIYTCSPVCLEYGVVDDLLLLGELAVGRPAAGDIAA